MRRSKAERKARKKRVERRRRQRQKLEEANGIQVVAQYWERRYAKGRNSGRGSVGENAKFKAQEVNKVITSNQIRSVIDWGCGDGTVSAYITPQVQKYIGIDVSPTIIKRLRQEYPKHEFYLHDALGAKCDLALSLDVLFHLIDDKGYYTYLDNLFGSAERLVLIHSTDRDEYGNSHVRHRSVATDIESHQPSWVLTKRWEGINTCQFFLYKKSPEE